MRIVPNADGSSSGTCGVGSELGFNVARSISNCSSDIVVILPCGGAHSIEYLGACGI